jgi:hypothetical protein
MADLHPNILTYLAAIAAFNANDLRTVGDHVRSDVVYRIPGRSIGKNLDTENCYAFRFVDGKVAHGQVFVSATQTRSTTSGLAHSNPRPI